MKRATLSLVLVLCLASVAAAQEVAEFDFETDLVIRPLEWDGAAWSMVLEDEVTGVRIEIYRNNALPLDLVDVGAMAPEAAGRLGTKSLSPFGNTGTDLEKGVINVIVFGTSLPAGKGVSHVEMTVGDFYGSDDDHFWIQTSDTLRPSPGTDEWDLEPTPFGMLGLSETWIQRAVPISDFKVICGSDEFPNSAFFDNIRLTLTDAPGGAFAAATDAPSTDFGGGDPLLNVTSDGGDGSAVPDNVVSFDFETDIVVRPLEWDGAAWSMVLEDAETGVKIEIYRNDGLPLDLVNLGDLDPLLASPFGTASLSPFGDVGTDIAPGEIQVVLYASSLPPGLGVSDVQVEVGDFFGTDEDHFWIQTSDTIRPNPGTDEWDLTDLLVTGMFGHADTWIQRQIPIAGFSLICGSDLFPNSCFYDNLRLTLAPVAGDGTFAAATDAPSTDFGGGDPDLLVSSDGGPGNTAPLSAASFDFETDNIISPPHWDGAAWSMVIEDVETGLRMEIYRGDGKPFSLVDLSAADPILADTFGHATLSPFGDTGTDLEPGVFYFVIFGSTVPSGMGVSDITWTMADEIGSDEDQLWIQTSDTTRPTPGTDEWVLEPIVVGPADVAEGWIQRAIPIAEFKITCGSDLFPQSSYLDNIRLTLTPVQPDGTFAAATDAPSTDFGGGDPDFTVDSTGGHGGLFTDPDISLSDTTLDFGEVPIGDTANAVLTITNDGGGDLMISGITPTTTTWYALVSPSAFPVTIEPGNTLDVEISFTPDRLGGSNSYNWTIDSNDPAEPGVEFDLHGQGGFRGAEDQVNDFNPSTFHGVASGAIYQSFKPSVYTLTGLELHVNLLDFGIPFLPSLGAPFVDVEIRQGSPDGTVIWSDSYQNPTGLVGELLVSFDLPDVSVVPWQTYWIVLPQADHDSIEWAYRDGDFYPDGELRDDVSAPVVGRDGYFVTYGENVASGNTPVGTDVTVPTDEGVNLTFDDVTTEGETTVATWGTGPGTLPPNFAIGDGLTYFDISTDAVWSGMVELCFYYGDMSVTNPDELAVLHWEGGEWVVVTPSTVNYVAQTICVTVSSLSPFTVAERINVAPVADAGPDRVAECQGGFGIAPLDGSGSWDFDEDPLTVLWEVTSGSGVIDDPTSLVTSITVTSSPVTVTLLLTDPSGGQGGDSMQVTVVDSGSPVINGGLPLALISLHADSDSGKLLELTVPAASDVCDGALVPTSDLVMPFEFPLGTTTVTWTATDSIGNTGTAEQEVTIWDNPPTADAGGPYAAECAGGSATLTLNGAGSEDPDGDALTYLWEADGATFNDATLVNPAITISSSPVTVTLTVTSLGQSATATATIEVGDHTPPVINGGAPLDLISVHADSVDGKLLTLTPPPATDSCDGALVPTCDYPLTHQFPIGATTVTWTATDDAGNPTTAEQVVEIYDHAPVAMHGGPYTAECLGGSATVMLDGSASNDPDGDAITYLWAADGADFDDATSATPTITVYTRDPVTVTLTVTALGRSTQATTTVTAADSEAPVFGDVADVGPVEATAPDGAWIELPVPMVTDACDGDLVPTADQDHIGWFPLGTTTVTWTATDFEGHTATVTQDVTVVDTTAPVISGFTVSPDTLWSPSHKMEVIGLSMTVADAVDQAPECTIVSVTSDEAVLGPEGTSPDWIYAGLDLQVRSERDGNGDGRVYTVTISCTDDEGNASTATAQVVVPHNQNGGGKPKPPEGGEGDDGGAPGVNGPEGPPAADPDAGPAGAGLDGDYGNSGNPGEDTPVANGGDEPENPAAGADTPGGLDGTVGTGAGATEGGTKPAGAQKPEGPDSGLDPDGLTKGTE